MICAECGRVGMRGFHVVQEILWPKNRERNPPRLKCKNWDECLMRQGLPPSIKVIGD